MPLISVIIPTFNRRNLLAEALGSVLAQEGFDDFEIVVVDDGSTDGTAEDLSGYGKRIRTVRQPNSGLGAARNAGIAVATGDYIALLDDDDLWPSWTLRSYARAILESGLPWLVSASMIEFQQGNAPPALREEAFAASRFNDLFEAAGSDSFWVVPSAACFKASVARHLGGFFTQNFGHEENDFWLRGGNQPGFVRLRQPICALRRTHGSNLSGLSDRNYNGTTYLVEQERRGAYPGGMQRAMQRQRMLAAQVRPVAMACAHEGKVGLGWRIYSASFRWNVADRRVRFLVGWPALALLGLAKRIVREAFGRHFR